MSAHALLGPSGAKRWMSCTPSARFEEQFEDQTSSYAAEGTEAHELGEAILTENEKAANKIRNNGPYYNAEMEEAVGLYVDIVMERFNEAKSRTKDAILMTEQRLDFSDWVPGGFGTGDVVIIADNVLEVIDLKYGKGVAVEAEDNPQLKLYGLGAYSVYSMLYDIETVRITIVQPRLDSVTTDEISVTDLLAWAKDEIVPKAKMAWEGEGEFIPGDHCKFCKGKNQCKALADYNLELFKYDLVNANLLLNDDIADILERVDTLTSWASDIKEYARTQAELHGIKYPGWKLVEGRSNRVYQDPDKIVDTLITENYDKALLYKAPEILGITALEKVVGKKKFNDLVGDYIVKPPGKPTLVKESDKRPELNSSEKAADDFK